MLIQNRYFNVDNVDKPVYVPKAALGLPEDPDVNIK